MQADTAGGVSWGVQDFGRQGGKSHLHSIVGAGIRGRDCGGSNAQPSGLHIHHFQQHHVLLVQQDRGARSLAKQHRAAYVIDVGMGHDDLAQRQPVLCEPGPNE